MGTKHSKLGIDSAMFGTQELGIDSAMFGTQELGIDSAMFGTQELGIDQVSYYDGWGTLVAKITPERGDAISSMHKTAREIIKSIVKKLQSESHGMVIWVDNELSGNINIRPGCQAFYCWESLQVVVPREAVLGNTTDSLW